MRQNALSSLLGVSPAASSAFSGTIHPRKSLKAFNQVLVLHCLHRKQSRCPRDLSFPLGHHFFYPTFSNGITLHWLSSVGSRESWAVVALDASVKSRLFRCTYLHIIGGVRMRIWVQSESGSEVAQLTGQGGFIHIHTVGNRHRGKGMPLRYNYDKPGKPWITNVFWNSAPWFFALFQPENSSRMKANFWRC